MKLTAIPRQSQELSIKELSRLLTSFLSKKNYTLIFEKKFAQYIGCKYAISSHSLRQGLYWSLKALSFQDNDEIILPAYEYFAIPATIIQAGLKPVFVDINSNNYGINPLKIEKAITSRTKAILVTHLNGLPAEMDKISFLAKKYKLRIIEDCAHACGASYQGKKVGSFDIGCFSFGFGKPISIGGGGIITTNEALLAKKLKKYQSSFQELNFLQNLILFLKIITVRLITIPKIFFLTGYPLLLLKRGQLYEEKACFSKDTPSSFKLKLSNMQAALAYEQLNNLEKRNQARIENAEVYNQHLKKIKKFQLLPTAKNRKNIYLHYPVRLNSKQLRPFIKKMLHQRINLQLDYCFDCSSLKIFKKFQKNCPVAKNLTGKIFFLPNQPSLKSKEIILIIKKLKKFFKI